MAELYQRVNYERQSSAGPRSFKLQTMHDLMHRLGHPHQAAPVIHVTGTKGKGSVSKMIGETLRQSGLKTGVYSSPHLETINQRISIDDQLISDDQLSDVLNQIQPAVAALDAEFEARNERGLTFFEIITAAGFQFFANENVDVVVLEVGLGGRLDSTNVCQPTVCVITNISLDHTKQLGDTIGEIAFEKAGIIKPGVPIVSGALHPEAIEVISSVAAERGAHLFQLDRDVTVSENETRDGTFRCDGQTRQRFSIDQIKPKMPGAHQQSNAALAIAACQILIDQGWNISHDDLRRGIANASLPGRTEILSTQPFILMDMAHNGASIEALIRTFNSQVDSARSNKPRSNKQKTKKTKARKRFLVATTRDKETADIVNPLVGVADELILTRYQNNPRGKPIAELQTAVEASIRERTHTNQTAPTVKTFATPELAWQYLVDSLEAEDAICIAGSAFLVAELRPTVQQWIATRI